MAKALGCPAFYSSIDTTEGKASRLQAWREGDGAEGGVVVATNALGLGIDVPDVRLVVHAGMPRRLRDFVQESGRGGRDGRTSTSVVVCSRAVMEEKDRARRGGQAGEKQREESTRMFVSGEVCRRMVLDEVMDGRMDRSGCEEGEEACDVCQPKAQETTQGRAGDGTGDGAEGRGGDEGNIRATFESSQQAGRFRQWQARDDRRQSGKEAERFKGQLARWARRCAYCGVRRRDGEEHAFRECPGQGEKAWQQTEQYRQQIEEAMFGKRRLADFSGCFHCGLPQEWCRRWKASGEDGGRFTMTEGALCQYKGVLVEMFAAATIQAGPEAYEETVKVMRKADGLDEWAASEEEVYEWFGRQIEWGGVQASKLCQLTSQLWQKTEEKKRRG
ncbi:hypothetical protein QIS74_02556 [Colletotrichum tabaci]|uniref:DNA 3'-5' helicase n=1 Tax=Colletotrichum tabaci TaxID=1209068 RepID=A0AAV9TD83_9PEZI